MSTNNNGIVGVGSKPFCCLQYIIVSIATPAAAEHQQEEEEEMTMLLHYWPTSDTNLQYTLTNTAALNMSSTCFTLAVCPTIKHIIPGNTASKISSSWPLPHV